MTTKVHVHVYKKIFKDFLASLQFIVVSTCMVMLQQVLSAQVKIITTLL